MSPKPDIFVKLNDTCWYAKLKLVFTLNENIPKLKNILTKKKFL